MKIYEVTGAALVEESFVIGDSFKKLALGQVEDPALQKYSVSGPSLGFTDLGFMFSGRPQVKGFKVMVWGGARIRVWG